MTRRVAELVYAQDFPTLNLFYSTDLVPTRILSLMPRGIPILESDLREAVSKSISVIGVVRALGLRPAGRTNSNVGRKIRELGIDTKHFLGRASNRGKNHKGGAERKTSASILVLRTSGLRTKSAQLIRALREIGREYKCEGCGGGPEWRGNPLTLQVDHKNRNWLDDRQENLAFLCPNCHSQTEGWCGRKSRAEVAEWQTHLI